MPALSRAPSPLWLQPLQAGVDQFSTAFNISAPRLLAHNSVFGAMAEVWPFYGLRLVALRQDVPLLFDGEQLRCLVAHEVAHLCQAGRSACAVPVGFTPSAFFDSLDSRELEADYLGALFCGREAMQGMLLRSQEVVQAEEEAFRKTMAGRALSRVFRAPPSPEDPSVAGPASDYPNIARRVHVLAASNETHYAGPKADGDGRASQLTLAAGETGKRLPGIGAAYLGYRWFTAGQKITA